MLGLLCWHSLLQVHARSPSLVSTPFALPRKRLLHTPKGWQRRR